MGNKVQSTLSRLSGNFWISKQNGRNATPEIVEQVIEIGVFEGPTAKVSLSGGATVNMGNFESVRVEMGIELPCYMEEVADVHRILQATIEAKLKSEVDELHRRGK